MTDVLSKRVTATGAVTNSRSRCVVIYCNGGAGVGRVTLTDGSGGATKIDLDIPNGTSQTVQLYIGENGVLFQNGIFLSTLTSVTAVTFFYSQ